jgi:small subunit ribosomal protein S20
LPHKKSTIKRLRQDAKINERNRGIRSAMATAVKKARAAAPEARETAFRGAVSSIDTAVKAGVLKKETADRKKSRLAKELGRKA